MGNFEGSYFEENILLAFAILQSGIVDRENKSELKKSREAMERIKGEPSGIIDI